MHPASTHLHALCSYETTYAKYMDHLPESTPLRILEIGLGCGLPTVWGGTGNSLKVRQRMLLKCS